MSQGILAWFTGTKNKYSLQSLQYLYNQLVKNKVVTLQNEEQVVEALG